MRLIVEYARIYIHDGADLDELESHLSMNAYDFGIDKTRRFLFVSFEEIDYVETILADRNIVYGVNEF